MNISQLKRRHIDIAGIAICAVLVVAAYVVGIRPIVLRREGLSVQLARLKEQHENARKLSDKVARIASEITQIKQELVDNPIRLEPAGKINSRIARIADIVGGCGLKLDQLRPDKSFSGRRYHTVPICLVGTGSFPTCVKVLRVLQRTFPDTAISSFEVTGDPTKPLDPPRLRVDLLWYAAADQSLAKG